ncbi:MAG: hypothetical protein JNN01_12580 [Opitutaceae bacterium]|nr:hypothetical protein [Opitutaceae bacterium]
MKLRSVFLVLAAVALAVPLSAQKQVPLTLELPKPLFVGTPRPISLPNLETPRSGPRPPMMVPEGTALLSRGKTVTASDGFPVIGELNFLTDGEKTGADGTFVEFGPGVQWAQIDLGAQVTVSAIAIWHFHAQARVYHDVVVQVSDDPEFKKGVKTLFNNDADNSAGLGAGKDPSYIETNEGRLIDAKGVKARYVRLTSGGNTTDELNHYVEVEVFGKP